jgi:glycosyltransferase involved in cell wall biosynthesis
MNSLSVVVPVCDRLPLLQRLLTSLLTESETISQVLVVVDPQQVASWQETLKCVPDGLEVEVVLSAHPGAGAGRNVGISHATGTYLWFLDSDDAVVPGSARRILSVLEKINPDVLVMSARFRDHKTNREYTPNWLIRDDILGASHVFSPRQLPDSIFQAFSPAPWNKIFRREFVVESNLVFGRTTCSNDLGFVLTALVEAKRICVERIPIYIYSVGVDGSLQSGYDRRCLPDALRSFVTGLDRRKLLKLYRRSGERLVRNSLKWRLAKDISSPFVAAQLVRHGLPLFLWSLAPTWTRRSPANWDKWAL